MTTFRTAALFGMIGALGSWPLSAQFGQQYPGQQYPGGQYPPGQYPPGQGPGQYPGGQRRPQQQPYPGGTNRGNRTPPDTGAKSSKPFGTLTTTGVLRVASRNQLIIEADDHRIIWYQLASETPVLDGKGAAAKLESFIPGDHLSVDSTEDDTGLYYAETVRWVSVGLPEERAAAARTWDLPDKIPSPEVAKRQTDVSGRPRLTRDGVTSKSDSTSDSASSDDGRPKFTRPKDDSKSTAASSPTAAPASDDDRPQFTRPKTPAADSTPAPAAQAPAPPKEDDAEVAGPPVTPDTPLPESARSERPVLSRKVSKTSSTPSDEPVLRVAGASTPASQAKASPTPAASTSAATPAKQPVATATAPKPELTQSSPASSDTIAAKSPAVQQDDATIAKARVAALEFVDSLPNFVTHQNTTRYIKDDAKSAWRAQDLVTASLTYRAGQEVYNDIRVGKNKIQGDMKDIDGLKSTGEFGGILEELFDPATGTLFSRSSADEVHGRRAVRYKFSVAREQSRWRITSPSQLYYAAMQGTLWIDPDTGRVMRLEQQASGVPKQFPLDTVELSIDYDFVRLDVGKTFLLPTESEALDCIRSTSVCMRNQTSYRNYTKFDAESRLIVTDDPQ